MLQYALFDNKLTPDPEDCSARVQNVRTIGFDEIVSRMTGRGLTLTDTEVQSVFNEFKHVLNEYLQEGNAISTPFLKIYPSIVGVFANEEDQFDSSRHAVRLNATLGGDISIDQSKIKTQKVKSELSQPEIVTVKDYQTQRENEVLTRGGTVELKGSDLKIYADDPEQGIFIGNDGQEVKVSAIMLNKPSQLIFLVPQDVAGGVVRITIKNKLSGRTTLRTSIYSGTLNVL